jgi:hypothetical protein
MKLVRYEDMPLLCDDVLEEGSLYGTVFMVVKDGQPWVRIEPPRKLVNQWCKEVPIAKGKAVPVYRKRRSKLGSRDR